ncbi:MAG: LPS-assembly protein LptD, partial [Myxococcales bacterium]|nr:LPS-assembly protein LptD [Myxococcales bacterium]
DVQAGRLEVLAGGWRAEDGLLIQSAGWTLRAPAGRGQPDAACSAGRLALTGPVRLDGPRAEAEASAVEACLPEGEITARGLQLRGPRLWAQAASARWQGATLVAEDVAASACGCADPPWRVTASGAEITPGEGAWLRWPVLWAGAVPVAAAPRGYLPLTRRRSGFLWPALGYDGEDGFFGRLPFFWAVGQSLDLTLAPGAGQGRGATFDGRLRWAASEADRGMVEAASVLTDGVVLHGRGSVAAGPARVAVDGDFATDAALWPRLRAGLDARTRAEWAAEMGLAVTDPAMGLGVRAAILQPHDADLPWADDVRQPAPEAWFGWSADIGALALSLDGRGRHLAAAGAEPVDAFDLDARLEAPLWIGPVRLRPIAGFASRIYAAPADDETAAGQRFAALLAGEAEIAWMGRHGTASHRVGLAVDGRFTDARQDGQPPAFEARDRLLDSRSAGLSVSSRWMAPTGQLALRGRLGYEAEAPVGGIDPPTLTAQLQHGMLAIDADVAGTEAQWARVRIGPNGLFVETGVLHLSRSEAAPWLRADPLDWPTLGTWPPAGAVPRLALTPRAGLTLGPLALSWRGAIEPGEGILVGQEGAVAWNGDCDCWHARLEASHVIGRAAPDVWLSFDLTPR